ncbi:MAG: phosphate signaling complex protein PhoU [Deltaproteobacteria bacterium]|jgi:phosphate transport system protein|nr:phosphate signaling complex protein PhoU [Deltaproteobacteria bacterium]
MVMGSFVEELKKLRDSLITMGYEVADMLGVAVKALSEGDEEQARVVIARDKTINAMENNIVDKAINLIAANQPVAGDLRFLAASLRLATELERMGDLGSNLARRTLGLAALARQGAAAEPFPENIETMRVKTVDMLNQSVKAFIEKDTELASKVLELDDEIDDLNHRVRAEVLNSVFNDGQKVYWGLEIINTAAHFERLGDHATNLAEETIYIVKGKNVRHHHF